MIKLFEDWLVMLKDRANIIIFGIVVLTLLCPNTIKAKNITMDDIDRALDNKTKIEEVIVKSHKNLVKSNSGAATKKPKRAAIEEKQVKAIKTIYVTATAYTSTPDQCWGDPFITASGKRVYDGLIAANGLKFGTKVRFPEMYGNKAFTVDDRMSSRYGSNRVDIWMDGPRSSALNFGKRYLKMEILEN